MPGKKTEKLSVEELMSRLTVSIPLQSILSCLSALVKYNPA